MKKEDPLIGTLREPGSQVFVYASGERFLRSFRDLLDDLCRKQGRSGILISTLWSANALSRRVAMSKLPRGSLKVVDTISLTLGSDIEESDVFSFLNTPASLESILIEVERIIERSGGKMAFVVLDSMTFLTKYYSPGQLSEFFQYLLSRSLEENLNLVVFDQLKSANDIVSLELSSLMDSVIDLEVEG